MKAMFQNGELLLLRHIKIAPRFMQD